MKRELSGTVLIVGAERARVRVFCDDNAAAFVGFVVKVAKNRWKTTTALFIAFSMAVGDNVTTGRRNRIYIRLWKTRIFARPVSAPPITSASLVPAPAINVNPSRRSRSVASTVPVNDFRNVSSDRENKNTDDPFFFLRPSTNFRRLFSVHADFRSRNTAHAYLTDAVFSRPTRSRAGRVVVVVPPPPPPTVNADLNHGEKN